MPLDNMFRAFGSDLMDLLVVALPLLAIVVLARKSWAGRSPHRRRYSWIDALSEAGILLGLACVAMVTLVPSGLPDDGPKRIQWAVFASDITYRPELTQVLGNLVLFTPIGFFVALRYGRRLALVAALVLPLAVEATQHLMVAGRVATLEDVLLGAVGCAIAAVVGAAVRHGISHGDSRTAAPAPAIPTGFC